ncbi:MAG: GTPase domain-containing protein [Deltaproteobacteria bacterium]|nr:GTPase domain-containing protein [Deltaproteobacteria bacterium]
MAVVNFATREITARIVYFGASGAGCNTNVRRLYDLLSARERSRLHKFGSSDSDEISWYFDYVPHEANVSGDFQLRIRVYSLPGGIRLVAHREEVLDQVDGVVFVADARTGQTAANLDSLLDLERSLALQGMELAALPVVLQVNHADASDARPVEDVAFDLNPYGFPLLRAVASRGEGVAETHAQVSVTIGRRIQAIMAGDDSAGGLIAEYRADVERDEAVVQRHLASIRARAPALPAALLEASEDTDRREDALGVIEVALPLRDLLDARPLEVLGAELQGERILIHLLLDPLSGAEVTRRTIALNTISTRPPSLAPASTASTSSAPSLPAFVDQTNEPSVEMPAPERPHRDAADLAAWLYGFAGLCGGIAIGILLGYLLGL